MNKNLNQIEIYGYDDAATWALQWTSTVETSIEYLGAHEFYWWPYNNFLMAKLSDGSSFKFFRIKDNFLTVKATADAALPWVDRIQTTGFNLFHAHGRVTVPPVFHDRFIYLYTTVSGMG